MRQQSLELRDESLSCKTEKSVIHVRQQNRAGSTTKERKTRKIEIERNTYKPLMSVSGSCVYFFFFFGCQRPICGGVRVAKREREKRAETRERESQRYYVYTFFGLELSMKYIKQRIINDINQNISISESIFRLLDLLKFNGLNIYIYIYIYKS